MRISQEQFRLGPVAGCGEVQPSAVEAGRASRSGAASWRMAMAAEAHILVDAAAYFRFLKQHLRSARQSIFIAGWDFDGRIRLDPAEEQQTLGDLLRSLAEEHRALEIRILVWSLAPFWGPGSARELLFGAPWQRHPRIHLILDRRQPVYAAHHQKIVCIDDRIAAVGGMDLTAARWDTSRHRAKAAQRRDPDGARYPPVHDVQAAVTGEAAAALGALIRERWCRATGQIVPPTPAMPADRPEASDFVQVPVAISRTEPGPPAIREVEQGIVQAIASARRWLYIETQYLTARVVQDALLKSLQAHEGPEIVIVSTQVSAGLMEHLVMGRNRDRLARRLRRFDHAGRFRLYFPVVPSPRGERQVKVHSKVMIVDDRLLRIGSANLNNRSMGVDTECDLTLEALTPAHRDAIAGLRARLLAEHLDAGPEAVRRVLAETGSLIAVVDRLNHRRRGLRPMPDRYPDGPVRPIPLTWALDPARRIGG